MAEQGGGSAPPRALVLDPADNVAVAVAGLDAGETVTAGEGQVTLREEIRFGHKFALRPLAPGEEVLKYHAVIGLASTAIAAGEHVHVHNVESARLPGPESEGR
ncbi:MAG: UxaA family hydrolase [Solirubrobacterales bacterium]